MKFDKRGVVKAGVIGIFVLIAVFSLSLIFSSIFSSAVISRSEYKLGESVKIDLSGKENYRIKIITPSSSFVQMENEKSVVFKPEEIGNYSLILQNEGRTETYEFEVVEAKRSLQNGLNFSKRSLKEQNLAVLEATNFKNHVLEASRFSEGKSRSFADGLIQTSPKEDSIERKDKIIHKANIVGEESGKRGKIVKIAKNSNETALASVFVRGAVKDKKNIKI